MKFFKLGNDRPFVVSVIFSLLTVAVGMVWTYRVGQASNHYAHRLGHISDGLMELQTMVARVEGRK